MSQKFFLKSFLPRYMASWFNVSIILSMVIGASERAVFWCVPAERIVHEQVIQIQYIYCRNLKGVFSYQNRLNPCLDGSELTDPVPDIAAEEVLSLRLVELALSCIPDLCSAYLINV